MRSMRRFGIPLVGYEGVADVTVEERDTKTERSGNFEAAQFPSGRTAISFVPTELPRPTKISLRADAEAEASFHGTDADGWTITLSGQTYYSRLSWMLAPIARPPTEVSLGAQYMEARRDGARADGYGRIQFVVSNLLWDDSSEEEPEPIELSVQDLEVTVAPIDDYSDIAQRLANTHGVEPTALVSVQAPPTRKMPLQAYRDFMDELLHVFRLVTGNLVDWYYAEAIDDRTKEPVERIHKHAATGPYSNAIRFRPLKMGYQSLVPKLDFPKLVDAFFNDSSQGLDRATLKPLINQFTNACDENSYLESRGLLASTLAELIAAKNAYAKGKSEVIPRSEFETETFPAAAEAIESTTIPGCAKDHIKNMLKGAYRSSLRQKLRLLNDSCGLGLSSSDIHRLVTVRDSLVHEGTYLSDFDDGGWSEDYRFLTWTNLIALCRLAGYDDELPALSEGRRLEV